MVPYSTDRASGVFVWNHGKPVKRTEDHADVDYGGVLDWIRRYHGDSYVNAFLGSEMVTWKYIGGPTFSTTEDPDEDPDYPDEDDPEITLHHYARFWACQAFQSLAMIYVTDDQNTGYINEFSVCRINRRPNGAWMVDIGYDRSGTPISEVVRAEVVAWLETYKADFDKMWGVDPPKPRRKTTPRRGAKGDTRTESGARPTSSPRPLTPRRSRPR